MGKFEGDLVNFNVIEGGLGNHIPIQYLSNNKKNTNWKRATVDYLETYGRNFIRGNRKFAEYRKMTKGHYSYMSSDFIKEYHHDSDFFDDFKNDSPDWVRHFDFLSIIMNAFTSIFKEMEDRYRVESIDEYSTNEFLRFKSEQIRKNAELLVAEEIERMLLIRGIDTNKSDFETEEEQVQFQQYVEENVKSLTPSEIENFVAKGFKVLAVEWAQNTLTEDKKRFNLLSLDVEHFTDYLLSGRFFRHYRVKYDTYDIERWTPEETFFSAEVDTKYPQKCEFIGRVRPMSVSTILNTYSHIMTPSMIKDITTYWGDEKSYKNYNAFYGSSNFSTTDPKKAIFPTPVITPFYNYFDHKINENLEDALGVPLAEKTIITEEGEEKSFRCPMPRIEGGYSAYRGQYLRNDIQLRTDSIMVTEGYWRSYKRMAFLVLENENGQIQAMVVDDNLLPEVKKKYEIKTLREKTLQELKKDINENNLADYVNTIYYFPVPEVWSFVKIKGNGLTLKEDLYLNIAPLDFQIKGSDSDIFDVPLPVSGLIGNGVIPHIINEQVGYNIQMNQITELTRKELGVIFALDITGIPDEFRGQSTIDALNSMWDAARDTGLMPLDLSRQNTAGNSPNVFQRQDLSYADMIQYKWTSARNYKQEAFSKLGITPEIIGAPLAYVTAEGVKQNANSSYALMSSFIDDFNDAKIEGMNLHIAFAQFCQANGIDRSTIFRKSDGDTMFLDIMKEDGEVFPLRRLGIVADTSNKDRKIIETIRSVAMANNTIVNNLDDVVTLFTNPVLSELKEATQRLKKESQGQQEKAYQNEQAINQQNIEAQQAETQMKYQHEEKLLKMKIQGDLEEKYIDALGRVSDRNVDTQAYDRIEDAFKETNKMSVANANIDVKLQDLERKYTSDANDNLRRMEEINLKAREITSRENIQKSKERIATTPKTVNIV